MRRLLPIVLGAIAASLWFAQSHAAQPVVSVQTTFTIVAGATFQSIAAKDSNREACTIQNTSTHILYVFFGATASATTAKSFQVAPNNVIACANVNGTVITDNIAVTTSTTADTGVLNLN